MRDEIMKNEYSKDYEDNDVLILNYDGSMSVDVQVDNQSITMYEHGDDGYECNYIGIRIEDWEEVKEFIEKQIKLLNKH